MDSAGRDGPVGGRRSQAEGRSAGGQRRSSSAAGSSAAGRDSARRDSAGREAAAHRSRPPRPPGPRPPPLVAGDRLAEQRRAERSLPLPDDADPRRLDLEVRRGLSSLSAATADRVAAHLVAAGRALDEDPARALAHARAARALGGRVGAVREAVGVAAYHAGEYAEAIAELRAARRITGSPEHLPLLADCERALGRPDRALQVARDPGASGLDQAARVELKIVASGARRDLGQAEAAVLALQGLELTAATVTDWTPRLWYAYADALLAAGRVDEARQWFLAVVTTDEDDTTDAAERLAALAVAGPNDPESGG